MKKILLALVLFVVAVAAQPAQAQIDTVAKQAFIVDANTGTVLLDKNGEEKMPTSSMSKIMTIYMAFGALKAGRIKLDDKFLISEKAWRMQGSKMFVGVGTHVPVEQLIQGIIVQSGNDAAVAMAEGLAGTEDALVDAMNKKAKELGMENSHFMNASGWPVPDHYSTAQDLTILAYHIIKDFPEYYHYFSEPSFTYNKIHQDNRNPLIGRVQGADGLKTGHTEIGGYGLMGSAVRDGRRVIMVLNGMPSEKARAEEGERLMNWAFRNFEMKTLLHKGDVVAQAPVWLGQQKQVSLVIDKDLQVLLPRGDQSGVKMTVKYQSPLKAPIKEGDAVGVLNVSVPGQPPEELKLLAAANDARQGIFGRVGSRFKYLFSGGL